MRAAWQFEKQTGVLCDSFGPILQLINNNATGGFQEKLVSTDLGWSSRTLCREQLAWSDLVSACLLAKASSWAGVDSNLKAPGRLCPLRYGVTLTTSSLVLQANKTKRGGNSCIESYIPSKTKVWKWHFLVFSYIII